MSNWLWLALLTIVVMVCVGIAVHYGERWVDSHFKINSSPPIYGIVDPDYARIFTMARVLAWSEGYALLFHGSFTRDLDLIAVPWTAAACDAGKLVRRIAAATDLEILHKSSPEETTQGSPKEHGRMAWTLVFKAFGDPRFVDFSIMPRKVQP